MATKKPQQVYMVEDCENSPGRILAVFMSEDDAFKFMDMLDVDCCVESRTLFYGQPANRGYNQ